MTFLLAFLGALLALVVKGLVQGAFDCWAAADFDAFRASYPGKCRLNKAEAHRLAHKLRDPKFYTARTKRAVNSGGVL